MGVNGHDKSIQACFHQMLVSRELGGAGLIGLHLALAIRDREKKSMVWIPGEGPAAAKARDMHLDTKFYEIQNAFDLSKIKGMLSNWNVGKLLNRHKPGVIHVHSPLFYGALVYGIKFSSLKSVVHVHLEEKEEGLRWAFKKPPEVIVTCARFLADYVRRLLPEKHRDRQKIVAVPNAVDTNRFFPGDKASMKSKLGLPQNTPLILMAANLAPHKGQATALRAAAKLRNDGVLAQFWFAGVERGGDSGYSTFLKKLTNELGLEDRVKFLGQRTDIPELLRAADAFLLPSTIEGLPLSIMEAQASKVAVLAAPTAGIPEVVVDGKSGYLIKADDSEGYAQRLQALFDRPRLHEEITETAYGNVIREYNWSTYVDRMFDVYSGLRP